MMIAITALLVLSALSFWIFRDRGYTVHNGLAAVTWQGKIQLWLLRAAVPLLTGVNGSLGFIKYEMDPVSPLKVPTPQGLATLTFYRPAGTSEAVLPLYLNHHGGGFVTGYPEQDDIICRYLARHAGCVVVNVDYVLAPEHPYPAQVLQCFEVAEQVKARAAEFRIDPDRIAVGGQSAGASIAAALCLMAKELDKNLFCAQLLNYGYFDTTEDPADKFVDRSFKQALGPKMLGFFQHLYLPEIADREDPFASPLRAPDLSGLPQALIITAQHDLMKNDGNRYAERLRQSGVSVIHREFKDADHGFTHNGPKAPAHEALEMMATLLKENFRLPANNSNQCPVTKI